MQRFPSEAQQSSSTASGRYIAENSHSPRKECQTLEDSLIFKIDDTDTSPGMSRCMSNEAKNRDFQGNLNLSSNTNVSDTQFEMREPLSRVRQQHHHSVDSDRLKSTESTKCKIPILVPMEKQADVTGLNLKKSRESEIPVTITPDVAGCVHHNASTSISKIEELLIKKEAPLRTLVATDFSQTESLEGEMQDVPFSSHHNSSGNTSKHEKSGVIEVTSEPKLDAADLKWTESYESEMMIMKDIPEYLYDYEGISKQEQYLMAVGASYAEPLSEDEYASESLPSNLSSDESLPSYFMISPRSPTYPLSTSAPSIYDLPQPTELQPSEQKTSTIHVTSKLSSTSNLSKLKNLRISDSHIIDESRALSESSSSVEILPEITANAAGYMFQEVPVIPSISVAPSQLNNTAIQSDSSDAETSQTLPTLNYIKLQNRKVPKSAKQRTSSESSVETVSREQADNISADETPTNKSPQKKKLNLCMIQN